MFLKLLFTGVTDAAGAGCTYVLKLDADRMQSFNPLLIMVLIPVFMWLYPKLERWTGIRISPLRRMVTGMILLAVSFIIVGWFQQRIDHGEQISIIWQTLPYTLLTIGEILFSATGLEFAFSQAPASMKSTIMSFWLLTSAVGNGLVALLAFLGRKTGLIAEGAVGTGPASVPATQFYLYAGLLAVVTVFFMVCAILYKERNPTKEE
jgi:POT family proton-dependent oligopeptide transporter